MRASVLATLPILFFAAVETAARPPAHACQDVALPIYKRSYSTKDLYLSPTIRSFGKAENIAFRGGQNPLVGHRIVAVSDLGIVALEDGSTVTLVRNVDTDGAIVGARKSSPGCRSSWDRPSDAFNAKEAVIFTHERIGRRESLRLDTVGRKSRLSFVVRRSTQSGVTETITPLIVTDRRVDAFGISPPPIDSPAARSILLVKQENDGSMTFAWYLLNQPRQ
jgi:hypothetical protein